MDSSGWIEYLADGPRAGLFAPYITGREPQIVSASQVYEVFKVLLRDLNEEIALDGVEAMHRGRIVAVDAAIALEAAEIAVTHRLAMADALIYATARREPATLISGDVDFEGLPGATVIR